MKRMDAVSRRRASFELLEGRQFFSAPALAADVTQLVFSDIVGGGTSASRTVTFSNTTAASVTIPAGGVSIVGSSATQFHLTAQPAAEIVVAPGGSVAVAVHFGATAIGPKGAALQVVTSGSEPVSIALRGLGTKGEQGDLEPSFQWILDTYQIPVRTGDLDPVEPTLDLTPGPNDEVLAPLFKKAGPGPVSIVPIAVYSGEASPALTLGYYTGSSSSTSIVRNKLYTVPAPDVQTLNPQVTGSTTFDPGVATFGLYSTWAAQNNRTVYSEDFRNTFIAAGRQRMFKSYPLMNADGTVVPNAYAVGNEEAFNNDYQDAVFIVRNVTPAQSFPAANPTSQVTGFVLINAETGRDIAPLTEGYVIDFAAIGTKKLSVRAEATGAIGSVKWTGDTLSRVEGSAPYSINGDSGTSYTAWTPALGANTVTVTPYSGTGAGGTAGVPLTVHFTVIDGTPAPTPPPPAPNPGDVILRAVADAHVRDGSSAGQNFGAVAELHLKKSSAAGSTREFFLKFDLSSVAGVSGAKLRLYGKIDHATQAPQVAVYAAGNTAWAENTINWNNRPAGSGAALATVTVAGNTAKWYEFDLSAYFAAEKAAGRNQVALLVRSLGATDPYLLFNSDEAATNRPELVVTPGTAVPPPPPAQELVVSNTQLSVAEGGGSSFTVKLASRPAGDVLVTIFRAEGDTDLNAGTTSLTFNASNWNVAQSIQLDAGQDADALNGTATFTVASAGLLSKSVAAIEVDDDAAVGMTTLRTTADAYARDGGYAGNNYGADAQLQLKKSAAGWNRESFLRFDLTSLDSISSAKLRLFGRLDNTQAANVGFEMYASTNTAWAESTLNWNNRPSSGAAVVASGVVVGTAGAWYELDVTSFLQQQKAAGATSVTLVLKAAVTSNATILFDSDEAANRPELVVAG